jgi:hypothetical protein
VVRALILVAFLSDLRFESLECKQFLGVSLPAKPKYYPVRVEGTLCTGPRFTWQEWVHEVALPWRGSSPYKKEKEKKEWSSNETLYMLEADLEASNK